MTCQYSLKAAQPTALRHRDPTAWPRMSHAQTFILAPTMRRKPPIRRFPLLRPRSVRGLLLAGYIVVALPLIAATAFSVIYVDRLADQSTRLITEGVQVTRLSQRLRQDITALERNARQYAVLADPALKASFQDHLASFRNTLDKLAALGLPPTPAWNLDVLRTQARQVAQAVATNAAAAAQSETMRVRFTRMHRMARKIGKQGNSFIDNELTRIQSTSREVRLFLILAGITLIPTTLLLAGLFTSVISRPIRQIESAIQRLGKGDFKEPVAISAPSAELDALGAQLDWMRRRLQALESEKNQFLQHMSHELKTPLASIREGADLLRDGTLKKNQQAQAEVLDILHQNSLKLAALIENLLDFAAWRQQHAQITREDIQLHAITSQVAARHQLSTDTRGLRVELPNKSVRVHADRDRLRLILDNIFANAVKFSPNGGTIRVTGHQGRDATSIEINDQGPGIEICERERIFAAFYQAHANARTHVRGTGIGLSVVREGVHAHGGTVEVLDSNTGARFRIVIPNGETA